MKTMLHLAVALSLLAGPALAQTTATTPAGDDAKPGTKLDTPDTLLAARGTAEVLVADIDAFMEHVPVGDRAAVVSSDERVSTLLQGILLNRQLTHEAEKLGLQNDPKVQREIQMAREQVLARHALVHYVDSQPQANLEQLAKESYLADKAKFVTPEVRVVQHILINNKDRSDDEAKALIAKVKAEADAPGADFSELVQKYSDDGGKVENKGFYRIDPETEPKLDPAFVHGARTVTEAGETSDVVSGMYGYHLIRTTELRKSRQLTFEETRAQLIEALRTSYRKRIEDEHVSDLRAQNPEIVTEVAQRLRTRYVQSPLAPAAAPTKTP